MMPFQVAVGFSIRDPSAPYSRGAVQMPCGVFEQAGMGFEGRGKLPNKVAQLRSLVVESGNDPNCCSTMGLDVGRRGTTRTCAPLLTRQVRRYSQVADTSI